MDRENISYDSSINKKSEQDVSAIKGLSKKNSQIFSQEDIDVDKYIPLVKEELRKINYSIEQRTFIDNIINILDKLIAVCINI